MSQPPFQRLVLAVAHGEAGPALLGRAAEAAHLLRLALHCVLIEDEALAQLAALPFVRELRLPTHDWRPLDPARLAAEHEAAEAGLRHTLAALAARLGIAQALEVRRGDPALCFGGLCAAGDIVVLADPAHRADRLRQLARHSPAAVLLLPARAAHPAAFAALAGDPALATAERLAHAAGVALHVVAEADDKVEGLLVMGHESWERAEALVAGQGVVVLLV
jgi:hypothetical protein